MEIIFEFFEYLRISAAPLFGPQTGHLFVAALLGAVIGLEREIAGKDPSLRTFSLICVGSCVFSIISKSAIGSGDFGDPSRIAAQIVTGIGFLGAGAIFKSRGGVSGLTTAALMWVTAAIGMAVGFNRADLAISTTVICLMIIYVLKIVHVFLRWLRPEVYSDLKDDDY